MRSQRLAAVAALGTCVSLGAHAQSSVTLGGYVDSYFQHAITGQGTVNGLGNGALNQSRFFFTGVEDLGGGTTAIFDLEAPFNPNTGTGASSLFSRNAYLALHNDKYGELRMGRVTTLQNDILSSFWMARWGASENAFLFQGNTVMNTNNTVRYESPSFYGFVLDAQYSFGTNGGAAGNLWEVKGQYDFGGLRAAGSFYRSKSPHDVNFPNSMLSMVTAGASYAFAYAIPYVLYQRVFTTDAAGTAAVNRYNVDFALAIPFGATSVRFDYGFTRDQAVANANADSASVRVDYSLSKRTIVYAGLSKIWNGENAYYQATSASGSTPVSTVTAAYLGKNSTSFIVGMRTAF
ncbi:MULTISPECIES: porin [unclassified Caballeronia]|jgi:predicted porin|uniref:porin n=1 Tax=unclassified Caballeronia TaxID=2646786 RepID=UPI002028B95F|nr:MULTISPECIES: porin [unclassified Caballeronia]MDR5785073.1 porin [Caballeronia sp. LP003]